MSLWQVEIYSVLLIYCTESLYVPLQADKFAFPFEYPCEVLLFPFECVRDACYVDNFSQDDCLAARFGASIYVCGDI